MIDSQNSVQPNGNMLSGSLQLNRVALLRGVQLSTMAAVSANRSLSNLIEDWPVLALGGPLPRVFATVGKERVGALDVESTLINCGLERAGKSGHVEAWESSFTHVRPVGELKHLRAHRVYLGWRLEPAIFSAILISPWTSGTEGVDDWTGNQICVVVRRVNVRDILAELDHSVEDILLRSTLVS